MNILLFTPYRHRLSELFITTAIIACGGSSITDITTNTAPVSNAGSVKH